MKTDTTPPVVPACIDNDAEFARAVRKYSDQIADCQLKIGELLYHYINKHGNRYGDATFDHLVQLTGKPESSLRNYHNLYRLTADYKNPTLGNLSLGVMYQIGRLLDCPDADTLVPKQIQCAVAGQMTAAETATAVTGILQRQKTEDERQRRAEQTDDPQTISVSDPSPLFTMRDIKQIRGAAKSLMTLARDDVRKEAKVQDSLLDREAADLADGTLRYIEMRVRHGQATNLESTIALLHDRYGRLCRKIEHPTKKTTKQGGRQ